MPTQILAAACYIMFCFGFLPQGTWGFNTAPILYNEGNGGFLLKDVDGDGDVGIGDLNMLIGRHAQAPTVFAEFRSESIRSPSALPDYGGIAGGGGLTASAFNDPDAIMHLKDIAPDNGYLALDY